MTPFLTGPLDDHVAFFRFDAALRRSFRQRLVRTSKAVARRAAPSARARASRHVRWVTALLLLLPLGDLLPSCSSQPRPHSEVGAARESRLVAWAPRLEQAR